MGSIDLIAKFRFLKERNVTKMYPMKRGPLTNCNTENVIFICRPETFLMDIVADIVKK